MFFENHCYSIVFGRELSEWHSCLLFFLKVLAFIILGSCEFHCHILTLPSLIMQGPISAGQQQGGQAHLYFTAMHAYHQSAMHFSVILSYFCWSASYFSYECKVVFFCLLLPWYRNSDCALLIVALQVLQSGNSLFWYKLFSPPLFTMDSPFSYIIL